MTTPISVHALELIKGTDIKVNVTGMRQFRFRLWVAGQILKLVSRVIGCHGHVNIEIS